jgi:iron(III) transport system ATP-binding protein
MTMANTRTGTSGAAASVAVAGARRSFGPKPAIDGVSLTVDAGSFVVLLGPSGSGKTTLLRCVAGIERLDAGTITIGGRDCAGPGRHVPPEQRSLAMVFQDYALWPHMTAQRNVEFALRRLHLRGAEAQERAAGMLTRVGLGHLRHRYPNEMSGGEQQRVALARALVGEAGLVLYDEPLSNLDADLREQLRLEIATLSRSSGATSLYITHDQAEAFALGDRIAVLRGGRIMQEGTPEEVYRRPANAFVARFTGVAGEMVATVCGALRPAEDASIATSVPVPTVPVRLPAKAGGREVLVSVPMGIPPGRDVRLFIRPSASRIVAPSPDAHLQAEVLDVAFCGRGYEHALAVAGAGVITRVFSERRWPRGAPAGVMLDAPGCLLLAVDGVEAETEAPGSAGQGWAGVPVGETAPAAVAGIQAG